MMKFQRGGGGARVIPKTNSNDDYDNRDTRSELFSGPHSISISSVRRPEERQDRFALMYSNGFTKS